MGGGIEIELVGVGQGEVLGDGHTFGDEVVVEMEQLKGFLLGEVLADAPAIV